MKIIGFNFTKIHGNRSLDFKPSTSINTNIEVIDIEKAQIEVIKDIESLKLTFKFSLMYKEDEKKDSKQAEISFEGAVLMAVDAQETKEILKSWKKKEVPQIVRPALFNYILQKCSVKALSIEEDLNLPFFPQLKYN